MNFVECFPANSVTKQIFPNKKRIHCQIGKNKAERNIIDFFKNVVQLKSNMPSFSPRKITLNQHVNPAKPKFMLTPTPTKPMEIVPTEIFEAERQKFLTFIDAFSNYCQADRKRECR